MKIAISAETTIDLTNEIIEEFDIKIVPFTIQLGDRTALDGEVTTDDIIEFVNQTGTLAKTSAVNEFSYDEHFSNILKEYDAIIHFSLSSEMSMACTNAIRAASKYDNVYVIDTRSLSTGIALLALSAKRLVDQGLDVEEVYERTLKRVPFVQASFELKRLDYLYKGGRCSGLVYFGANLLKIRPQIIVENGKMVTGKKYRGNYNHIVKTYCRDVLECYNTPDLTEVFLTYTTADEDVLESAKQILMEQGFKRIHVTRAGGTITSHCGEDCLGILYINDGNDIK